MPEEPANATEVNPPTSSKSFLNKNVPNPLAKNPNIHTHKVFASIGLILVSVIVILFGAAIVFHVNLNELFRNQSSEDTSLVTTPSAKAKVDTYLSKIKLVEVKDLPFKAPFGWSVFFGQPDGFDQGHGFIDTLSNYPINQNNGSITEDTKADFMTLEYWRLYEKTSAIDDYSLFKPLAVGQSQVNTYNGITYKKVKNLTVDGEVAYEIFYSTDNQRHDNTFKKMQYLEIQLKHTQGNIDYYYYLILSSYPDQPIEVLQSYLDQIVPTFKFL